MAKTGKSNPRPQQTRPTSNTPASSVAAAPGRDWLARPETDSDGNLRVFFYAMAGFALLIMLWLAMGSGVNADDKYQVDYSNKLVNYYGTFGKDTAALNIPDGNMHLYGGFFEIVTGFTNKALGFKDNEAAYHHVRHLWSAFFGWLAIFCAGLFAYRIAGWRAGLIALIILFLSPRFLGDSLMNPKDIPFAAGYMLSLYAITAVFDRMPLPRRKDLLLLVVGLGIALATRAGGLLAYGWLLMFGGLHFLMKNGGAKAFSNTKVLAKYLAVVLGTAAAGYVLAVLFWPYALQSPLKNPFIALSKFAELEVRIRVLYEGANMMSDITPWHYPLKWILYTIPLAALAGIFGSLVLLPRLLKRYNQLWVVMALLTGVFPIFYIIYKDSVIHDGWRHLTFAYPPLVVAAALFWNELARFFTGKKAVQYAVFGVMGLLLADAALFIAANRQFPYVYFNPIEGGTKGAYGYFETDYWGISTRQGIEWLEKQGILHPNMTEPVVIATNMHFPAKPFLSKYGDKVKLRYLKWDRRYDEAWDYALYPTRFIDGSALQRGLWPPDNTIHVIEAGGAPLLAIMKDTSHYCFQGNDAYKKGDIPTAIDRFEKEVATVPDNEIAWGGLAQSYLSLDSLEKAKNAAEKALEIAPDDTQGNNVLGLYWIKKDNIAKANDQFNLAVRRDPSNAAAWYYLALIANDRGDPQTALNHLQKSIRAAPAFRQAYELAARIYEENGNAAAAQQYRAALGKLK